MLLSKLSRIGKKDQPTDWPKSAKKFDQIVDEALRVAGDVCKGLGQHVISSKRKKNADQQLALAFKESVDKTSNEDKLFIQVVRHSADILNNLSALRRDFELRVDKNVIAPLLRMVDDTRADIEKERRALKKAMSDMREARDQLERATTQLNQLTSLNGNGAIMTGMDGSFSSLDTGLNGWAQSDAISAANNRCTQAQSVLDEKERDLMASKDKLLSSLYSFIGQESNHVTLLVDFFRAQEAYLEESLQTVRRAIPELVAVIESKKPLTVFHRHLPDHLAETDRSISYALEACISRIDNESALTEEGLFRKSGGQRKTELLVKALNLMEPDDELFEACDPITIASALKQYLNSLPEPLITFAVAERWAESLKTPGSGSLELIEASVREMPTDFRHNLAYLCLFLHKVASYSAVNKMTPDNLSIVLAPNLYRLRSTEATAPSPNEPHGSSNLVKSLDFLHMSGPGIKLVNLLITNADTLFAEDKVYLIHLTEEHLNCNAPRTHSRSPSNASLTETRPPKPVGPRLYPVILDDTIQQPTEPSQNPSTTAPAIGFVIQDMSDLDLGNQRAASEDSSHPQPKTAVATPIKPSRKKTIAPRPPFPPPLPPPLMGAMTALTPQLDSASELKIHESSGAHQSSTEEQMSAYPACLPVQPSHSEETRSKSPNRMDECDQLKAPPKRPPRPPVTTPK
ncbi:SH3 domain-binding protein 1 [Fasciola hepatica]|uniref:SH3 domain-binding protein 1 n=1 Tax=Fasciola hepatica TaxID=6192 RepID=A0A4E0S3F8_FASHE|nr:SH3 domain-binding protein 1 [Fasciola hepatica]